MTKSEAQVLKIALIAGAIGTGGYFALKLGAGLDTVPAVVVTIGAIVALTAVTCPFYSVGGPSGFRNPWVYASRRSWVLSQWAAAIVLSLLGTAVVVLGLEHLGLAILLLAVGLPTSLVGLSFLSWAVWRRDPSRMPLG